MESKMSVDPNFVFALKKTIGMCGGKQGRGTDLLDVGDVFIGNGEARIPVDTEKNREAIGRIRTALKMSKATDAEVLCAHANGRVLNCTGAKGASSLNLRAQGHEITARQPSGSKIAYIEIVRR